MKDRSPSGEPGEAGVQEGLTDAQLSTWSGGMLGDSRGEWPGGGAPAGDDGCAPGGDGLVLDRWTGGFQGTEGSAAPRPEDAGPRIEGIVALLRRENPFYDWGLPSARTEPAPEEARGGGVGARPRDPHPAGLDEAPSAVGEAPGGADEAPRGVDEAPPSVDAARALVARGKVAEAVEVLRRVVDADPDDASASSFLGRCLARLRAQGRSATAPTIGRPIPAPVPSRAPAPARPPPAPPAPSGPAPRRPAFPRPPAPSAVPIPLVRAADLARVPGLDTTDGWLLSLLDGRLRVEDVAAVMHHLPEGEVLRRIAALAERGLVAFGH